MKKRERKKTFVFVMSLKSGILNSWISPLTEGLVTLPSILGFVFIVFLSIIVYIIFWWILQLSMALPPRVSMAPANNLALVRKVDIIATKLCMYVYVLIVYVSKSKFCFVIKCMDSVCIYEINQINI